MSEPQVETPHEQQIQREAKTVGEAADATADEKVLTRLWELTKDRLTEENSRHVGFMDRASKYVTYSFSILALVGAILAFSRDLLTQVVKIGTPDLVIALGLTMVAFIWAIVGAFFCIRCAVKVLRIKEYRTWNEDDLRKVHLGGPDQHHGYTRYMIKAGWNLVTHNSETNEEGSARVSAALNWFRRACGGAIFLVVLITSTHLLWSYRISKTTDNTSQLRADSMADENSNNNQNSGTNSTTTIAPAAQPIPSTPNPTAGAPHRRGGGKPTPRPDQTPANIKSIPNSNSGGGN